MFCGKRVKELEKRVEALEREAVSLKKENAALFKARRKKAFAPQDSDSPTWETKEAKEG